MATLHKLIGNVGKVLTSNSLNAPANVLYVAEFDTAEGKKYGIVNWRPAFTDPQNSQVTRPASWVLNTKGWVLGQVQAGNYTIAAGVIDKLAADYPIAPVDGYSSAPQDVFDNDTNLKSVRVWNNDAPFTILGSGVTTAYIQSVFGTAYLGLSSNENDTNGDGVADTPVRSGNFLDTATDFVKKNWLLILVVLVVLYFLYTEFFAKKSKKRR